MLQVVFFIDDAAYGMNPRTVAKKNAKTCRIQVRNGILTESPHDELKTSIQQTI